MAIAIYRYCCVFYSTWLLDITNRRSLERSILLYIGGKPRVILCLIRGFVE